MSAATSNPTLRFSKMQGAGNDFCVIDATVDAFTLSSAQIKHLADRRFGVGCDQVLVILPARDPANDFAYDIYNADGGQVEHCGNGARCFMRYVRQKGLTQKTTVRVEIMTGVIVLTEFADETVLVDMGAPRFEPSSLPFTADGLATHTEHLAQLYELSTPQGNAAFGIVSMGNPHLVQIVKDTYTADVLSQGAYLERHAVFPQRVNVGFMQIVSRSEIKLRVFERGVGETLACGTGACAAVASGIARGLLDATVLVHCLGGDLQIQWAGGQTPLTMRGPAITTFEGTIRL